MILYATGNIPVFCVRKLFFSQGIKVLFNFLKLSYFKNVHGNNSNKHIEHEMTMMLESTQNLLRITISTVRYFCVFVIYIKIDFKDKI